MSAVPISPAPPLLLDAPALGRMAGAVRVLAMDAVERAGSGHPGMPMGMADVATVLFARFLKFSPADPRWPDRDRFILSAGHGSMLLYALAYLTGYEAMTLEEIRNFRQLESLTPGHPEYDPEIGAEMTTGPLGQGLATAVGFALAERSVNARFGDSLVDHHTYVICSDGDLMEGISHEACALAGHLGLGRLIVLYDDNRISIDGCTSLSYSDDVPARFRAYGWDVQSVDGHDVEAVSSALESAKKTTTPSLVCCKTVIGFGAPNKAGSASVHGSPLGESEIAAARAQLGWTAPPFEIPADILTLWCSVGARGQTALADWTRRAQAAPAYPAFQEAMTGDVAQIIKPVIQSLKDDIATRAPTEATRQCSGNTLACLVPALPSLIGGSADLTGSVNTRTPDMRTLGRGTYDGRYIHYGVREHGMAAAMNGMALHGGVIPYGGTFLQFSDYARPALRLAALMRQRVVHVMTHDSIGLGEDGPTHQPVEHLASLRAIPNLSVFRPCDGIETAECWELALRTQDTPSVLSLTRQALPTLRQSTDENLCARGAYVLRESTLSLATDTPEINLFASGSEVSIAAEAFGILCKTHAVRLVSVPCMDLFWRQPADYIQSIICRGGLKVAIEAGVRQGWERFIGAHGIFIGMEGFGASAPAKVLYNHFGITAHAIVEAVTKDRQ